MSAPGGRWRGWRWIGRGLAGLVAFVVLAVLGVMFAMHTRRGRELLRAQVEHQLASTFVGGATVGGIEGSPFGELTLHDLVINGADRRPFVSVKTLVVGVGLLPLMSHQARVIAVRADGLDVDLRRDAHGALITQTLTRPGPPSAWSVQLPEVQVRHGHVRFDTGGEVVNFDGLDLDAWAVLPHAGPIDAGIELRGTWRERRSAVLGVATAVHVDRERTHVSLPYLTAKAGEVTVVGNHLQMRTQPATPGQPARAPMFAGDAFVNASVAAVSRLVPGLELPADLVLHVTATPVPGDSWTAIALAGRIDHTPIKFTGTADLDTRHARGELETGALDLARLSRGKVAGAAAGTVVFDVRPGGPGALPVATATVRGWGEVAGIPRTALDVAVTTAGERANAQIHATGPGLVADLAGAIHTAGGRLAIEGATVRVTATDPARATGGKAPLHGALRVDLRGSGALRPSPALTVTGTIDGQHLRMADLSVARLHVALDAAQLPNRPYGRGHVQLVDLVRQGMQLGEITVDATDRPDGKIAVAVRSRPKQNPWLVDADALVTPPADIGAGRFAIELVKHHVRAGSGSDWYGTTGHIDIGPERIALRDLTSASPVGRVAVAGSFQRAGAHRGDLAANVDIASLSLSNITRGYHGKLDAHVAVTRARGAWQGDVRLDGHGISFEPSTELFDGRVDVGLHGRDLALAVDASSSGLGSARLAVQTTAPATVAEPAAWQRLGRDAIRAAKLTLRGVDIHRAAQLAGLAGNYSGRIDGDVDITAAATTGRVELRDLVAPALRGIGVTAVLDLAAPSPTELTPRVTVTAEGTGTLTAQAELAMPDRPFDPAAWRQLGRGALHGASVRAEGINVDPGLLDRFGVVSELRGRAGIALDIGPAARSLQAVIDVAELRGGPIAQPIDVHATTELDDRATTAGLTVASRGAPLIQLTSRLPVSLPELLDRRGNAAAIRATPLAATAKLASTDAARLLAVFGRSEVTSGQLDGAIDLGGTLGTPTVAARLTATRLTIPPGPHGKPVRTVERLAITAAWDGTTAKLDLDGTESAGGTLKLAAVVPPRRLRDGTLTLQATRFDMVPILAFAPGPAGGSSGELDANLRLTGLDLRTAQIAGEVHLRDARIPTAPTVGTLRSAKIDAVVADHEIRLVVDGKLGAGTARVTGTVALDGAAPNGGKAKIVLRKVSPIGSVEPQITADIDATLSRDRSQWRADLVVANGYVVVPSDRGEKLKPVGAPPDMVFADGRRMTPGQRAVREPTSPIFLVTVDLRSTRVESEEFRGVIRGKLEIRADGEALAMSGGIDADRGDLDLFGRRYYVDRASVHFDGPVDPLLDIRITHDFADVTTVTEVHGRLSKPELVMSSDPGTYSQGQLLGFLLGGEPGGDPASGPLSSQASTAGQSLVANQIGGYVKKALPVDIDVLRYEAATATSAAAVTVGTWLNSSLFLAYRQNLGSRPDQNENMSEGQLEYWLTRRVVLQGTVGDRADGLDLLWRKRY
jgi:autotransporter translocation and assembly factor TamB